MSVAAEVFRSWYWDPLKFCQDVFPESEQPREWQPEVLEIFKGIGCGKLNPWIAIAACRKAGKTRLASFLVLWFLCTRANSLVLTIAPTWDQVADVLWTDLAHLWIVSRLPGIFPSWRLLQTELHTNPMTPKWRALGITSDEVQNLEGRHPASGQPVLVILDESKGIKDVFFESIQGMLGEAGVASIVLAIGTPGVPLGWFYRAFTRERRFWETRQIRASEIPRLAKRAADRAERVGDQDPFYLQQEMAEFTGGDDGAVIPFSRINLAIGRKFISSPTWKRVASLDIAGTGSDESVLTIRHGPILSVASAWQGWDPMQSAAKVASELRKAEFKPDIFVYDAVGLGAGVGSRIKELLADSSIQVFGFNGGKAPRDKEQYANLKAEEVFLLRARFLANVPDASGELGPDISIPEDEPMLIEQLSAWTSMFNEKGRTRVIDPDDSPDYADSAMMNFAADRLGRSVVGANPKFLQ